jgi:hypothetical protein
MFIPLLATFVVILISLVPRVRENAVLQWSFWGAAAVLLVWWSVLFRHLRSRGESPAYEVVLRSQHYIQACVQFSVYAYWGYYWRPVYDHLWLLAAQLAFAYAFDMLLAWSRREKYLLGFGPFPIVFSTNLFLWFRDDWFYLQFLMLAVGFLGKAFVRWQREGTKKHIFNPSAFSLGLFSLVLILTGSTGISWGQEIASTLTLAPRIYLYLFAVGLVVMYFFSITIVTGTAAATLFGLSALYFAATGVPYFLDSEIPAAVFLGMHLLVTDPSTSPRSRIGKAMFGTGYGLSVFMLYGILGAFGAPTFYDKLLAVPLLNLSIKWIDRVANRISASDFVARFQRGWTPSQPNLAHMGIWILFFGSMTALGRTDGMHTGDSYPFWEQACAEGRPTACRRVVQLDNTYCGDNSGWACNQLGARYREGALVQEDPELALTYFARACEARYQPACLNLLETNGVVRGVPRASDLRLLLREGGLNLTEMPEPDLYARACVHEWTFACARVAGAL